MKKKSLVGYAWKDEVFRLFKWDRGLIGIPDFFTYKEANDWEDKETIKKYLRKFRITIEQLPQGKRRNT